MRPRPTSRALAGAALAALLAGGVAPASAAEGEPASSAPSVATSGPLTVVTDDAGATVIWRPGTRLREGDARVQLVVDGVRVDRPLARLGSERYGLRLPGRTDVAPSDVAVVAAGRVLAGAGAKERPRATGAVPSALRQPSRTVTKDPGAKGKHRTVAFTYRSSSVRVGGFPAKTEVLGRVVLPATTAKGERPLVVFLHGRHSTCYSGSEDSIEWPCFGGMKPIPSYRGYEYVQRLLASQGYATVSISANGVNGQDWDAWDGGAAARSELVRHHLDLLRGWNAKGGSGDLKKLKGRLDLQRIVLVGHSRGGEGVNRTAVDLTGDSRYRVRGQVLLAPTDFGFQVSAGVPTSVVLPYCDGDVFDLQGQVYVDQGRYVAPGDKAMRSAVLVMGANHNFFNTEWTPGLSQAPSWDDWMDSGDPTCGTSSSKRLTAKQQRAVGATYVAAGVRAFLRGDKDAHALLDGSPVRARSAGKAVVLSAGFTGSRKEVVTVGSNLRLRTSGGMRAERCVGTWADDVASCAAFAGDVESPHWLVPASSRLTPWQQAVVMRWSKKGASLRLTPSSTRDLSSSRRIDLRVAAGGDVASQSFDVRLTDAKGRTLTLRPSTKVEALPVVAGSWRRVWAQTVRVEIPRKVKGFDLERVRSVTLRATSSKGHLYLLDAFTSGTKQAAVKRSLQRLPRFAIESKTVTVSETPSGLATVNLRVRATGTVSKTARIAVVAQNADGTVRERVVSLAPGTRSVNVPVTLPADGVHAGSLFTSATILPVRNAMTTTYQGVVDGRSATPPPQVTFPTTHVEVTQGQTISWPFQLSGLTSEYVYLSGSFDVPSGGPELTTASLPVSYFAALGSSPPSVPMPLSEAELYLWEELRPLKTTGTVEIPTRALPKLTEPRYVALTIWEDGLFVSAPVTLTAKVNPAP